MNMAVQQLQPGTVISGFKLEEKVHAGGMAALWRVTREDIAMPILMKIPFLGPGESPTGIVGFEVEQMILPKLSGRHVPRFFASGDFTVQPYIVMERVEGASLRDRLDQAPLPPDEVAFIGARVATALHDLHRQHVIHLDIKPSNIMFRSSGEAVLIDFGVSRHDRLPDLLAEEFRVPMGTGPYISPEQVLHVRNDPRSDLFALGVMLYHLLTGQRPYGNPQSVRALRGRLYRDPMPPRAINPDCPPWLQEVILHCLEVSPVARYETAARVAFDLQHPEQVVLTSRAQRRSRDGMWTVARRWFRAIGVEPEQNSVVAEHLSTAPIIVAAIDLSEGWETLADSVRGTVKRMLEIRPAARLACVTVLKTSRIAIDADVDEEGRNLHVKHLVELKHWARPIGVPRERITFHVLQAPDPGAAIVEYASANHVDHILIGSRGSSTLRRYLGSVSSKVVAEATCSVTVVRTPAE